MVFGLGADGAVEAGDGFEVVAEDFGLFVEDELEGVPVAAEIGDEHLDIGAGGLEANLADGVGPDGGAAIVEFIAVDAGDDDVLEVHGRDGRAHAGGLFKIERRWPAGGDVAESAGASADIAEDHDSGGAGGPAFAKIGAFGALADGVQALVVDEVEELEVFAAGGHFHFEPGGLALGEDVQRNGHKRIVADRRVRRRIAHCPLPIAHLNRSFQWAMGNRQWAIHITMSFPIAFRRLYLLTMSLRILALGDIVGRPGRWVISQKLAALVRERSIDLVVANSENVAGGSGITTNLFNKLRAYGVDVVTLGDHLYRRADIIPTMQNSERIVRPANLARAAAGRRYTVVTTNSGVQVAVFCLLGRIFMNMPSDDPFAAADWVLSNLPTNVRCAVCDMHAEASSEKIAMGHWLDGRVSLIFGTHTHVPTADGRVLAGGSAYISDVGMCGPYDSVLGRRKDKVLKFMTTGMPVPFEVATGDVRMCGAISDIDPETGRAMSIERIEVCGGNSDAAYDADDARTQNAE